MPVTMKFHPQNSNRSKTQKVKSKSPISRVVEGTQFIKSQMAHLVDRMFAIVKTDLIEAVCFKEAYKRNKEIQKFVETRAANTIARAYKSRKAKLDAATSVISKAYKSRFTKKNLASTKIAQAYRAKLDFVHYNKDISELMCEGLAKKEVYRKQINDLLISHRTPQKLSNLYFYFCKFGNKQLGYSESSELKSIIQEIVGCVFVNTSFKSTNFDGIIFKQSKFLSYVGHPMHERSSDYMTRKRKFGSGDYELYFSHASLIESQFIDCEFFNIKFGPVDFFDSKNVEINNKLPTFKNCNFFRCDLLLGGGNGPSQYKYNASIAHSKYNMHFYNLADFTPYGSAQSSKVNPDGTLFTPITIITYPAEIVFENCKFDKTSINSDKLLMMPGSRNMMFLNCRFESNTFIKEKFRNYYFKKCTFNNVFFIDCQFVFSSFEDCTFNNTTFRGTILCAKGTLRFRNCKLLECTFNVVRFSPIPEHEYKETVIFDNTNIINNSTFRECHFSLFKFNFDSLYSKDAKSDTKLLNLRNNVFIDCNLYGVNFDNCDLEGTKFSARQLPNHTLIVNKFNWFGHVFIVHPISTYPAKFSYYGDDKTQAFKNLCNEINPHGFALFQQEFRGAKLANKKNLAYSKWNPNGNYAIMKYSEYNALNINVLNFRNRLYNIKPYDYFVMNEQETVPSLVFVIIAPAVSMFNSNIKNCNFQSAIGFETFDFTQVKKNYKNNPDLTAVNFTNVKLLNANFKGTNIVGTIFEAANIGAADFRNCVANANTSFQNTTGIELVPYQLQRPNGTLYIQGSKNNDTGREIEFSEIQQAANETHARIKYIIDNKDKLFKAFEDTGIPPASDRQFSSTLSTLLISSHGGLTKYAEKVVISETGETIITFLDKLRTNYSTILQTQTNLTNDSMVAYIKKNFPIALTNYISFKLNYSEAEKTLMLANLVRAFSDEFMMHLVMFKPSLNGNWCFLQLVTLSVAFLILNTDLYIHNFIQYYFNEIFNAHGKGSPSCTLGMVERWITVHSQAMEAYLMLLKKNESELRELSRDPTLFNKIIHYNPANPKIKDNKITLDYIKEFNNSFSSEKIHNKYIMHTFINVLKPYSILPESEETDIGFDLDYNVSALMRKKGDVYIKKKIDSGTIKSLQDIYDAVVEVFPLLIIENNYITQERVAQLEAETRPLPQQMYREKRDALYNYVKDVEAKDYIIGLMGFFLIDLKREDINTTELDKLQQKLKDSGEMEMETLIEYYDDVDPTFVGGQKRRRKSSYASKARGLSPKIEYILETLVESTLINKLKAMTFEEFSNINNAKEEDYEALSSRASGSSIVSSSSSSSKSNLFSFGINDKPLMLKNATIQDRAYMSIIRNNYDAMQENYKSMIANMRTSAFKSAFKSAFNSAYNSTKKASLSVLKRVGHTFKRSSHK
jgi:uncharacterized protein YjbI with pentapeptide repeats